MVTEVPATLVTIGAGALLAALDTCRGTTGNGRDGRGILTAVCVTIRDGRITFAGADGFALIRVTLDAPEIDPITTPDGQWLLGTCDDYAVGASSAFKTVITLLKTAAKDPASIAVTFGDAGAEMIIGATRITLPYVEGSYPRYEELIPAIQPDKTISRTAYSAKLLGGILAIAAKYGQTGIARMRFTGDRSPVRIDWNGEGWHATAAVMPMFVDWGGDADALGD